MKKITCIVQEPTVASQELVTYAANLAHDFELNLELLSAVRVDMPLIEPQPIIGTGLAVPVNAAFTDYVESTRAQMLDIALEARKFCDAVHATVHIGFLQQVLEKEDEDPDRLFWIVQQTGEHNIFNNLWGTLETDISKDLKTPVLNLPKSISYKKPDCLTSFVKGDQDIWDDVMKVPENLGFKTHLIVDKEEGSVNSDALAAELRSKLQAKNKLESITYFDQNQSYESFKKMISQDNPSWVGIYKLDIPWWERMIKDLSTNEILLRSQRPVIVL